jgi:phosphatidylglycerophosphate synthase
MLVITQNLLKLSAKYRVLTTLCHMVHKLPSLIKRSSDITFICYLIINFIILFLLENVKYRHAACFSFSFLFDYCNGLIAGVVQMKSVVEALYGHINVLVVE